PAGEHGERHVGRLAAAEQTVDDLVDRAVAPVGDDGLGSRVDGFARERCRMSARVRRDELELEGCLERSLGNTNAPGCVLAGKRVLDEHGVHGPRLPEAVGTRLYARGPFPRWEEVYDGFDGADAERRRDEGLSERD